MKRITSSANNWVDLILSYPLLLLLTYGATSVESVQNNGSGFLSRLFIDMAGSAPLVAHLLAGTILFAAFWGLTVLATRQGGKPPVKLAAVLALTLPAAVYSRSYGSLGGALTAVSAAATVLFYIVLAEKLLDKHKAVYAVPMFLLGLVASLFHEALSAGLCILSVGLTVKYGRRSWALLIHSIASCAGTALLMVTDSPVFTAKNLLYRVEAVADGILAGNWPLLVLLTAACLLLVQPLRSDRSKRCNRILQELLWPVAVFALCPLLKTVAPLAAILKITFTVIYALGLWNTIQIYVHREARRHRLYRLLAAVTAFTLPLCVMGEQNEGLLYLPCLLMAATTLLLWGYALQHFDKLERFWRRLVPAVCALTVLCVGWISVFNGITDDVREDQIRQQRYNGAAILRLPEYPFPEYRAEETAVADLTAEICPWEEWDWMSYFTDLFTSDSNEAEGVSDKIPPESLAGEIE